MLPVKVSTQPTAVFSKKARQVHPSELRAFWLEKSSKLKLFFVRIEKYIKDSSAGDSKHCGNVPPPKVVLKLRRVDHFEQKLEVIQYPVIQSFRCRMLLGSLASSHCGIHRSIRDYLSEEEHAETVAYHLENSFQALEIATNDDVLAIRRE